MAGTKRIGADRAKSTGIKIILIIILVGSIGLLLFDNLIGGFVDPNRDYFTDKHTFADADHNSTKIANNALEMGYAIRRETNPEIYEFLNAENEQMFLTSDKKLYINYPNQFALLQISNDIEFRYNSDGSVSFVAPSGTTFREAYDTIVDELKSLGILDRNRNYNLIHFKSRGRITISG